MAKKLTEKQAAFCREYIIDLQAGKAALRAGFSEKNCDSIASQLLKKTQVADEISRLIGLRAEKSGITAERVLREIEAMAFYDPAEIMLGLDPADVDGDSTAITINGQAVLGLRNPADIRRLPEMVRRAVVGWGYDKNQNFTLKLADKSKALDQLARHLGLYNDKLQVEVTESMAERLARAKARRAAS